MVHNWRLTISLILNLLFRCHLRTNRFTFRPSLGAIIVLIKCLHELARWLVKLVLPLFVSCCLVDGIYLQIRLWRIQERGAFVLGLELLVINNDCPILGGKSAFASYKFNFWYFSDVRRPIITIVVFFNFSKLTHVSLPLHLRWRGHHAITSNCNCRKRLLIHYLFFANSLAFDLLWKSGTVRHDMVT